MNQDNSVYLGIDSSCYTTSFVLCDNNGDIVFEYREMLDVKAGSTGLRQSDAVFNHIKNFNKLFGSVNLSNYGKIRAVSASVKPRNVADSYMPVFMVGKCIAGSISDSTGSPFYQSTHQDGHIYSALINNQHVPDQFLAVHLSGGTSEILDIRKNYDDLKIDIIGHTLDISAGKVFDRIGVKMGFDFPSGKYVEEQALHSDSDIKFKISVKECNFNFSGLESQVLNNIHKYDYGTLCNSLQIAVAKTISYAVKNACQKFNCRSVLFFGGVFSNIYLRNQIKNNMLSYGFNPFFADVRLSSDNAVGLAVHAKNLFLTGYGR